MPTPFGVESPIYAVIRGLVMITLLLIIGVAAFQHITLRAVRRRGGRAGLTVAELAYPRASVIAAAASWVLLLAVVGRLIAQCYTFADPDEGITRELLQTILLDTGWGRGWLLQASTTLLAIVSYIRLSRSGRGAGAALIAVLVLSATPALSGHALSAGSRTPLAVVAGTIHVLGAGGWLGALAVLVLAGMPAAQRLDRGDRGAAVAELVNAFSPTALICTGLVLVTGTAVAWIHLGGLNALLHTPYGQLLLIKLGVLSGVAAIGAYNWQVVRPALGHDGATLRLRRSAVLELGIALVVVAVTAVLVATPTPAELAVSLAR
jgi:putative copper export protein